MDQETLRKIADVAAETARDLGRKAYVAYGDSERDMLYVVSGVFAKFANQLSDAAENSDE